MFGKQRRLPTPGIKCKIVTEKRGVLKRNNLNPGDEAQHKINLEGLDDI